MRIGNLQTDLFSVMGYGLQDGFQCWDNNGYIQKMSCEEKVAKVSHDRQDKIAQIVQENLNKS